MLIDDFDRGGPPNTLGFCPDTFTDASMVQKVFFSYTGQATDTFGGRGYSPRIDFDVFATDSSPVPDPFGGYVQALVSTPACPSSTTAFDLQQYNFSALTFAVRRPSSDIDMEIAIKSIDDAKSSRVPPG